MRAVDRVLSVLVAVALVALGIIVPIEVVYALVGGEGSLVFPYPSIAEFLRETPWSSGVVVAISAAVAMLGLLLVLAELWRRRPGLFTVATDSDTVVAGMSRRSLERTLTQATVGIAGVTAASAAVRRRRGVVNAVTPLRDPGDLPVRVQERVDTVMESLSLVRSVPVRVRLRHRRDRP